MSDTIKKEETERITNHKENRDTYNPPQTYSSTQSNGNTTTHGYSSDDDSNKKIRPQKRESGSGEEEIVFTETFGNDNEKSNNTSRESPKYSELPVKSEDKREKESEVQIKKERPPPVAEPPIPRNVIKPPTDLPSVVPPSTSNWSAEEYETFGKKIGQKASDLKHEGDVICFKLFLFYSSLPSF